MMAKKVLVFQSFTGGIADDAKIGIKNSSAYLQGLDVRSSPSQMSVLPGMAREDNGIVKDLILNEVMVADGTIYAVGNAGYIYKRTTAGVWSEVGKLSSGAAGIDYRHDSDSLYISSYKSVSLISSVTGSTPPVLIPDKYSISYSTYNNTTNAGFNVAAYQTGSTQTTAIATAFTEAKTSLRYFQTDIEPLNKISVFIVDKGTGDWTMTLHDGLNTVLATATVTNANLNSEAFNDFIFSTAPNGQVRVYPAPNARTYHTHLISTVADGTVSSTAINDLSSCDLQVWADRLVQTNSGLHCIDRFLQYELIQNGNYISTWEPISDPPTNAEWQRHRLVVPSEYDGVGLDHTNEYSIAAWGKTTTSSISVPQEGLLTFWDGLSDTYNYDVPIPEGTPQGLHVYMNIAYYYAGGTWWAISSPTTQPVPVKKLPGAVPHYYGSATPVVMYPYGATVQNGIQFFAWPGSTTNTGINFGVYSWGNLNKNYAPVLTYDYLPSTGSKNYTSGNNLQLGMVKSLEGVMHLSWRDDQGLGTPIYGIDVVSGTSKPATYAKYQTLLVDNGYVGKYKAASYIEAYFPTLPAGATVTLAYSLDRGPFVVDTVAYSTTTLWQGQSSYARFDITSSSTGGAAGRFRELQGQVEIRCASSVTVPGGEPSMPPDGRSRAVACCPASSSPATILYQHQAPCHAPWIRTKCFPSRRRAADRTAPAEPGVAEALTAAAKATPRKRRRDSFRCAMALGRYHAVVPGSTSRRPLHQGAKSRASYSVCRTATASGCSSTGCPRPIEEPTKESNHALVYLCRKRS